MAPLRECEWVVDAKRPFAGPEAVLAYLSRYTHRVAISNSRLIALDERGVSFRWKDYRDKGRTRHKTMTLAAEEFMRRFLLHVLPAGFHRIRHYGLLANGSRKASLAAVRELLHQPANIEPQAQAETSALAAPDLHPPGFVCRQCGRPMIILETFVRGQPIRAPPSQPVRHEHLRLPASEAFIGCPSSTADEPPHDLAGPQRVALPPKGPTCSADKRPSSALRAPRRQADWHCHADPPYWQRRIPIAAEAPTTTVAFAAVSSLRLVGHLPSCRGNSSLHRVRRAGVPQP